MDLKAFKSVIFDLFHTLTSMESAKSPGRGTSEMLGVSREEWNKQLLYCSEERLRGIIKDPFEIVRKMARAINPAIPEEVIREAVKSRIERFKYSLKHINPGVINTLKKLKGWRKLLGLVSNSDAAEVAGWRHSPLRQYFDSVIFSCEVGYIKPEKEIFKICLSKLGVSPHECVYVADGSMGELQAAKELGMTTVLATHVIRHIQPERIIKARVYADYEIDEIEELLE